MRWNQLESIEQLELIHTASSSQTQVIFKHSTRCSISAMAKSRLDRMNDTPGVEFHYLDLIRYREISNLIADKYHVYHESPQILIIQNGECTYEASHMEIIPEYILEQTKVA